MSKLVGAVATGVLVGLWSVGASVPVAAASAAPAHAPGPAWAVLASPDAGSPSSANSLAGVSCVSPTSCMAVGGYRTAGVNGYGTLSEHWDGQRWALVASPDRGTASATNMLNAVSCPSVTACTAVGTANTQALTEQWNGTRWALSTTPFQGPASGEDVLNGVDCTAPSSCVAVGYFDNSSGHSETLVEHWDGTRWSVVPSPNRGPASAFASSANPTHDLLEAVACTSPSSCTAVGISVNSSGDEQSLAERWDGHQWALVPSPAAGPASGGTVLNDVSCTSHSSCTAVGYSMGATGGYRTLVEHWDGTKWSFVPSPDEGPANLNDVLSGVSCTSAASCVAVGYAGGSAAGGGHTLAESWDGAKWSVVPSPAPGKGASALAGVSCATPSPCVAVGAYQGTGTIYRALVAAHRT